MIMFQVQGNWAIASKNHAPIILAHSKLSSRRDEMFIENDQNERHATPAGVE
jgi:hypothetical protein